MACASFDTLKFSERLTAAGISPEQAKAEAEALRDALAESLTGNMATKADIAHLDGRIAELRSELGGRVTLLQWMLGVVVAGIAALILKAFF